MQRRFLFKWVCIIYMQEIYRLNFPICLHILKDDFSRNPKILVEITLTQRFKDVVRHLETLKLCDVVTTLLLRCHSVTLKRWQNVVYWRLWNFHFQHTGTVDATNRPMLWKHCHDVFVLKINNKKRNAYHRRKMWKQIVEKCGKKDVSSRLTPTTFPLV